MKRFILITLVASVFALTVQAKPRNQETSNSPSEKTQYSCKSAEMRLTSEELRKRIVSRDPVHVYNFSDLRVRASDVVLQLQILVSSDGTVECASYKDGNPLLISGAIDSVRRWHFRPLFRAGKNRPYSGVIVFKGEEFSK
jgi:hypothetical protein